MTTDDPLTSSSSTEGKRLRVLISYIHDSEEHKKYVRLFATHLQKEEGIHVRLDQWVSPERQNWGKWMTQEIKKSDYVIAVASPGYQQIGDGDDTIPDNKNLGGKEELSTLQNFLQGNRKKWTSKILPVILPGRDITEIPMFLEPYSADHYKIDELSSSGIDDLLRTLFRIPRIEPPTIGSQSSTIRRLKTTRLLDPSKELETEHSIFSASAKKENKVTPNQKTESKFDIVAAHTPNSDGSWHSLGDHSRSTGRLAGKFAEPLGASNLAEALGLFHDAGKAYTRWQHRLREVEGTGHSVGRHEELGTRLLRSPAQTAAMAVLGHHRGLNNTDNLRKVLKAPETDEEVEARERFFTEVPEARTYVDSGSLVPSSWQNDPLLYEMGLRMTFSALVDADRLDTASHREGRPTNLSDSTGMSSLVERYESRRQAILESEDTRKVEERIAAVRQEVYEAAVTKAQRGPGVYRLAAPTGSGKTLAQGAFALHHAARWDKRRVVVAMPLITVTEQNAQVYRDLLDGPDPVVLEHHSQAQIHDSDDSEQAQWARLAVENWDAPFVLTTTVQLFESLFGRTPAQVRKLHRLANSVLVLDEVQALPPTLLLPILDGLRTLVEHFGVTVLLTSATQPAFQSLSVWRNVKPDDLIDDVRGLFERARRVEYQWRLTPQPTFAEVADEAGRQEQAMIIVNSTKDARRLYRLLREQREDVWHLSSRMYPRHRSRVLSEIGARLDRGDPAILVTTQLVEAGVDISFPVVWRAMAPADSLQQAAGRSGRHGGPLGTVVIFDPADGHAPSEYKTRISVTRNHFGPNLSDPEDETALEAYYEELYRKLRLDPTRSHGRKGRNAGQTIQENRRALNYRAVTDGPSSNASAHKGKPDWHKAFRMIGQQTVPVVVVDEEDPEVDQPRNLLKQLNDEESTPTDIFRSLQPWTVQLPVWTTTNDLARERLEDLGGDLYRWCGEYASNVGIDDEELILQSNG